MIGIIVAISKNGIIGITNKSGKPTLPFHYPEDLKHFKSMTTNSTVIMGRMTYHSIGKPLPDRDNIIISSSLREVEGATVCGSIRQAIIKSSKEKNIWFIGGASIYEEGLQYADTIVATITPDIILDETAIKMPWINPQVFKILSIVPLNQDNRLNVAIYKKV